VIITILRKPLEGSVADNVLKHGCGAINIDATRIITSDNLNGGAYAESANVRHDGKENWRYERGKDVNPTSSNVSGSFGKKDNYYSAASNYGDSGGASRFFKQFKKGMTNDND